MCRSRCLEHEINERFSRLYSLTPDAIKIVEVKENGYFLAFPGERDQKVFERIAVALKDGQPVTVSFWNVTSLTSAFLNAAIGQLYGTFSQEKIRAQLKVKDMVPADLALLKRVVDTAKEYFKDPERFSKAERAALRGQNA